MIKILQVVSCFERGGTEAFLMNHYRHLDKSRIQFDFLVLTSDSSPYDEEIKLLGGRIIYANVRPDIKHLGSFIRRVKGIMQDYGPYEAVHSHINITNSYVMLAAKWAGIRKRISHSHNINNITGHIPTQLYRKFQRRLINNFSTEYCACGELAGKDLYGTNISFKVINNGIDVDAFVVENVDKIEQLKLEFNISKDTHVYGNISRFDVQKNFLFALDIFNEILKKHPNSVLILGGQDGSEKQAVVKKVQALNIQNKVRLVGPRNDIKDILHLFDCYLFPSKYEGLGIAALEAQAAGIPVVSSTNVPKDVDMNLDLLRFLPLETPANEWADIAMKLHRITDKNRIPISFKEHGYNIEDCVKQMETLYEK